MKEPRSPAAMPSWLLSVWPALLSAHQAALDSGLPADLALEEAAAMALSPALPMPCRREAAAALAQAQLEAAQQVSGGD